MFEKIVFVKSVFNIEDLPKLSLPEIVVCGRSNVGKSTFINTIFNKKNLAKVSSTPGKTKSINFFLVDDKFYLVDLPGFGFAKVSKQEQNKWKKLVEDYFVVSQNISMVFHLVDSRILPSNLDMMMNEMLENNNLNYVMLFNKVDKLNQSEFIKSKKNYFSAFINKVTDSSFIPFSSISGVGKKEVLKKISESFSN